MKQKIKIGAIQIIHIALHFIIPALAVAVFFRQGWKVAYIIMVLTMLVDIDHLLAVPVYDPVRCSIGFHPLHTFVPIIFYGLLCFVPKSRVVGMGLVIHMGLDSLDCQFTSGVWFV